MIKNSISCKVILLVWLLGISCNELDLVPEDAASTASWYQTEEQFRQSLNEGYRPVFFPLDSNVGGADGGWDDDTNYRTNLSIIKSGALNSEFEIGATNWENIYKGIVRMLAVLEEIENQNGVLSQQVALQFEGEARFMLGVYWSYMITHYGDVPFYENVLTVEESFAMPRTDKNEILQEIYAYFDFAAQNLPISYSNATYATSGAAYAFKARAALYMGDFATAAEAARACIDLDTYGLHPNFGELFLSKTKQSPEIIFKLPRSTDFLQNISYSELVNQIPRNNNGFGSVGPTWDLLASFECVDGLPVDESPLFDPQNPFKNRDPRLLETIVPLGSLVEGDGRQAGDGTRFLNFDFNSYPLATRVQNYTSGEQQVNNDTKSNQNFASFNGLVWKKGIDEDWIDQQADNDILIMRYADVLLMYAEAMIELGDIDTTVLDALNTVRDRAYANSDFTNPVVTTTSQEALRYIVRNERRAEFANESRRYMDLIRWRTASEIIDGGSTFGLAPITANIDPNIIDTQSPLIQNVVEPGLWFWGLTPQLDENGTADFEPLLAAGLCQRLTVTSFPNRQYLWPIPADERRLNNNLSQNEGY
ncbi:MAG: RagB/SusD family nutrient uptake outer membrane protein [Leeuwenhoekiella sp.]